MVEHPFERLLDQIGEFLQVAKSKGNSPLEGDPSELLQSQLAKLKGDVELYLKIHEKILQEEGVSPETANVELAKAMSTQSSLSPREKQLLERAQKMKGDATFMKVKYEVLADKAEEKKRGGKRNRIKRQKKFKQVGGKKGWLPM